MSLKDGVAQPKKAEFKAPPKKPNILDKNPAKKLTPSGSKEATPSPPGSPLPANANLKLEELMNELKKMKTVILKHEVRIRDLEEKFSVDANANNIANNGETLLPDEV